MFPVKSFFKKSSLKNHIRYAADSSSGVVTKRCKTFESNFTKKLILVLKTRYSIVNINAKPSLESMYQLGFGTDENSSAIAGQKFLGGGPTRPSERNLGSMENF